MSDELVFRSGYAATRVESEGGDELRLHAPDGRICLKIKMTPQGPEVELASVALSIATSGDVAVACQRFRVTAEEEISLVSRGPFGTEGRSQRHVATHGEVAIRANDDVALDGERIRLNTAEPLAPMTPIPRRRRP